MSDTLHERKNDSINEEAPTVSVLMPAYNHAGYIGHALDSIETQTVDGLEVIVVDDGSTDGTLDVVRAREETFRHKLTVISTENQGVCKALDTAREHAQGEFIAFLASDDWYLEDRFSAQLEHFRRNPDVQLLYANGIRFNDEGKADGRIHDAKTVNMLSLPLPEIQDLLCREKSNWFLQTVLLRRSLLEATGPFDDGTGLDDWPLNIRMFNHFKSEEEYDYIDVDVAAYRLHETNSSRIRLLQIQKKINVINRYCPEAKKPGVLSEIYWAGGKALLMQSLEMRNRITQVLRLSWRLFFFSLKRESR